MYTEGTSQKKEQNREIEALLTQFIHQTVEMYNEMPGKPVCPPEREETLKELEKLSIPATGRPIQDVCSEMIRSVYSGTRLLQHPRSFSCIPSTASLLSWMGDVMTNAYNPHASCQLNAPAADLIEKKLIRWMCDLAGYPAQGGGLFVSGGSIANLTALTAARDARLSMEDRCRAVVYLSRQTHSSAIKGLLIIGFSRQQIRILPTDGNFRMDLTALETSIRKDLKEGKRPFAVIASAGTTNTGSIDPLQEIAGLCRKYDLWMHVDGAFGASALLSARCRRQLAGIEYSDSLSWDAHKWMMQTYGCSAVLVRDRSHLVNSFSSHPEYLKDSQASEDSVEFWDLGPELTRPARSLKLWITLQAEGSRNMEQLIDHGCSMAELTERLLRKTPHWEIISPAQLGIINFRYMPDTMLPEEEVDQINLEISREITQSGFAQIFTTVLDGKKVLRMCTIHPETTRTDIQETIRRLTAAGSRITLQHAGQAKSA